MRIFLLAVMAASLCLADAAKETLDGVAVLAAGLSEGNASAFLAGISKSAPGYDSLAAQVRALVEQNEVSSSVSELSNDGDDNKRVLALDWYLEVKPKSGGLGMVRRRETIRCAFERVSKKKWIVTSIEPTKFFSAQ